MTKNYNEPFNHVDYNAMIDGCGGNGVLSGLLISERGIGQNMSVDVASGSCSVGISYTEATTTNVVISASHATLPRKDIIIYDTTASSPDVITGSAATEPIPPNITNGDILLGIINIAAAVTVITNSDIEDGRVSVGIVPIGLISMWHGTLINIPNGWNICDGTNGTPDLQEKFIRGAAAATDPGSTGGSDTHTLTIDEMPSHAHDVRSDTSDGSANSFDRGFEVQSAQNVTTQPTGGGSAHNNMPSYYELAYIMKL